MINININTVKKFFLVAGVIAVIILSIILITNSIKSKDNFTLLLDEEIIDIQEKLNCHEDHQPIFKQDDLSCLNIKQSSFHEIHRKQLVNYLAAVYPLATEKFSSMGTSQLNDFYNSLWFYYNCDFSGNIDNYCWTKICDTSLPYAPSGLIYNLDTWWYDSKPLIISTEETNVSKTGGSIPGQTFIKSKMGPAPVWQYARAIFRNIYTPMVDKDNKVPTVLKGSIEQIDPPFKYPHKWWLGVPSHGYMEINAASEPGLGMSCCPTWYDGWVGSGIFLDVGNTIIARNKSNAVFVLAQQMLLQGFQFKLLEWFNAGNALEVLKNIYNCQIESPKFDIAGVTKEFNICKPGRSGTNSGRLPEAGQPWGDLVKSDKMENWCDKNFDEECLYDLMYGGTYNADRVNTDTMWDEPIFAMASFLNYDTVQMTMSANSNGFWQYEILELRYVKHIDGVRERDYSQFIKCDSEDASAFDLYFKSKFLEKYMNLIPSFLSLRDPFDLDRWRMCDFNQWDKASNISPSWEKNKTINTICKNNLSKMYSDTALTDCVPTCSNDTKC